MAKIPIAVFLATGLLASATPACADEGTYFGLSMGRSYADVILPGSSPIVSSPALGNSANWSIDTDSGFKIKVGQRLDDTFSIEGGYIDFGRFNERTSPFP